MRSHRSLALNRRLIMIGAALYGLIIAAAWAAWWQSPSQRLSRLERAAVAQAKSGDFSETELSIRKIELLDRRHAALVRARLLLADRSRPAELRMTSYLREAMDDPSLANRARKISDARRFVAPPAACPDLRKTAKVAQRYPSPRYAGPAPSLSHATLTAIEGDIQRYRAGAMHDASHAFAVIAVYESGRVRPHSRRAINDLRQAIYQFELDNARDGRVSSMLRVAEAIAARGNSGDVGAARDWVKRAADTKSLTANLCLISILRALEPNPDTMKRTHLMLVDAASRGSSAAVAELGVDFYEGRGTARDPIRARNQFERVVASNRAAQTYLGGMLLQGEGGPADVDRGRRLLIDAARGGSALANYRVAVAYRTGRYGFPRDARQSIVHLTRAAQAGRRQATIDLARAYASGDGVAVDQRASVLWANRAIESGAISADLLLLTATALARGDHLPRDRPRAERMLSEMAQAGSSSAMLQLGRLYFTYGSVEAQRAAIGLLQRAAQLGQTTALVDLGRAYASGLGVDIDPARSVFYLRSSAIGGNSDGMIEYGRSLATGFGLARDERAAAQWYLRAARMGNPKGMIAFADASARGEGLPQSFTVARQWIEEGVKRGDPESIYWLAVYLLEGYGGQRNAGRALALLQQADGLGFSPARVLRARIAGASS